MVVSVASGDTAASKQAKKAASKKLAQHPPFKQMVLASVAALKQRKGSSRHAIAKYIKEHYKVKENFEIHVKKALLKAVTDGALIQASGIGASGSFKIAKAEKKPVSKVKKTTLVAKKTTKKSVASKAKVTKRPASKTSKKKVMATKSKKPTTKAVKKPVAKKSASSVAKKSNSKSNVKKSASSKSVGKKA